MEDSNHNALSMVAVMIGGTNVNAVLYSTTLTNSKFMM